MRWLLLAFLMGCLPAITTPVVELPEQLPSSPPACTEKMALPQTHILSDEEKQTLMGEIDGVYPQMKEITNYLWSGAVWNEVLGVEEILRVKMASSTTLDEFRFYRDMFGQCLQLINEAVVAPQKATQQLIVMYSLINKGPNP
jgi:hypothetical protein